MTRRNAGGRRSQLSFREKGGLGGAEVQGEGTFPNVHPPSPTILQLQGLPSHCQGQMSPQIFISFLPISRIANFLLFYILHITIPTICHNISDSFRTGKSGSRDTLYCFSFANDRNQLTSVKVGKCPCDARTGRSARLCNVLEVVTRILSNFVLAGNQRPRKYLKVLVLLGQVSK